jgi:uncharacterized protein YceH (UPF0502 family)
VEPLDEVEARVLGALVEKQRTVPDTYPLTLNALVAACNQTSNRDPVVSWSDGEVQRTLDGLKVRSVTRYRHVLDEAEGLDPTETAVLAVLLLRGPQTLNEVRTRTERYADMEDAADALDRLAARSLAERRPGAREPRWADTVTPWRAETADLGHSSTVTVHERPKSGLEARVDALEAEVAELKARLGDLLD